MFCLFAIDTVLMGEARKFEKRGGVQGYNLFICVRVLRAINKIFQQKWDSDHGILPLDPLLAIIIE